MLKFNAFIFSDSVKPVIFQLSTSIFMQSFKKGIIVM